MGSTSIIITTYNDSQYLDMSIQSALAQNILEVIIIDDHSDVDPIDIVSKYNVKYIRHDKNRRLSQARNTAITDAIGENIITLDADDYFYPDTVNKMAKHMQENNADIVYGSMIGSNGTTYTPIDDIKREYFKNNTQLYASSMFKKKVWESVGGYWVRNEAFPEDWDFWARICVAGFKFSRIDLPIYHHTFRPNSEWERIKHKSEEWKKLITEHAQL